MSWAQLEAIAKFCDDRTVLPYKRVRAELDSRGVVLRMDQEGDNGRVARAYWVFSWEDLSGSQSVAPLVIRKVRELEEEVRFFLERAPS